MNNSDIISGIRIAFEKNIRVDPAYMDLEDRKRFLLHQLRHSLTSDEYSIVLELLNYCLEQQYITAMGFSYLRVLDLYHMQESQ